MQDFQNLFHSSRKNQSSKVDQELWQVILDEADKNGDGKVSFEEFQQTMQAMIHKSWLRKCDRSPTKSSIRSKSPSKSPDKISPYKSRHSSNKAALMNLLQFEKENSPCRKFHLVEITDHRPVDLGHHVGFLVGVDR